LRGILPRVLQDPYIEILFKIIVRMKHSGLRYLSLIRDSGTPDRSREENGALHDNRACPFLIF
jgi:hypothetical protein